MKTRSGNSSAPSADGHQPEQHYSNRLLSASNVLTAVTSTLDTMKGMLDSLDASTEFENGVKSYLALLHSQVVEACTEHAILRDEQAKLPDELIVRHCNICEFFDDLALNVVKTEQYSQRDTVTVAGLTKPDWK